MTRILRNMMVAAAMTVAAGPAFAQTNLVLPPYNGDPAPKVATESDALTALNQRGVADVQRLGKVGDYWESDGVLNGRPIIAYVFDSGAIEIKPSAPDAAQSAALPPINMPEQSAELPQ
jgi:hypothetical protein